MFVRCETNDGFGVLLVRREAEREAVRKSQLTPIHVWGDVAGVGGGKRSYGADGENKASGESAGTARQHALVHGGKDL